MEDEKLMIVTQKGQTTIPKDLRDAFDISAPGRVTMEATDEGILVKRVPTPAELTGDLEGVTDEEDRTGVEALREERRADAEAEEHPRERDEASASQ
jgi:antitoxin PrlF